MPTLLATCAPSDIPLPPSPGKRKTPVHLGLETDDSMASQRPFLGDTIELVQTRSESLLEIHTRLGGLVTSGITKSPTSVVPVLCGMVWTPLACLVVVDTLPESSGVFQWL